MRGNPRTVPSFNASGAAHSDKGRTRALPITKSTSDMEGRMLWKCLVSEPCKTQGKILASWGQIFLQGRPSWCSSVLSHSVDCVFFTHCRPLAVLKSSKRFWPLSMKGSGTLLFWLPLHEGYRGLFLELLHLLLAQPSHRRDIKAPCYTI